MSRYFAAIDACVAAAGYNAFHELIALAVPSLYVPMPRRTDDQPARARWAADAGLGLAVDGPADPALAARIAELLERRDSIRAALTVRPEPRGAADAAGVAWQPDRANGPHRARAKGRSATARRASSGGAGGASSRACRRRRGGSGASSSRSLRRTR